MKKNYLLFIAVGLLGFAPLSAQAQTDTVFQKREVIIIDDDEPAIFSGESREVITRNIRLTKSRKNKDQVLFLNSVSLGYNGLVEDLGHLKLPEEAQWMDLKTKSINFKLMLLTYKHNFNEHFSFRTGLELEYNNFRFSNNIEPVKTPDGSYVVGRPVDYTLKKSKLVSKYFNIPILAQATIGKHVDVYGGVVGGWRWKSYTKLKSSEHGKEHNRGSMNLRNFHYGYTAGVSIYKMGVYATYYPHSIFKSGLGPDVRQVNIGLVLSY